MIEQTRYIKESLEQVNRMIIYSKQQADASINQSKSAELANSQSEKSTQVQLRAYIIQDALVSTGYDASVSVRNVGQTPALDVSVSARAMITTLDTINKLLDLGLDSAMLDSDQDNGRTVLGTGSIYNYITFKTTDKLPMKQKFEAISNFSDSEIDDFKNGRKVYWISGSIMYKDIFGERHKTTFCYYLKKSLIDGKDFCKINNQVL